MDARYEAVVEHIRKSYKADFVGVIPVEVSVREQLGLIQRLSTKENGALLSYDGTKDYA